MTAIQQRRAIRQLKSPTPSSGGRIDVSVRGQRIRHRWGGLNSLVADGHAAAEALLEFHPELKADKGYAEVARVIRIKSGKPLMRLVRRYLLHSKGLSPDPRNLDHSSRKALLNPINAYLEKKRAEVANAIATAQGTVIHTVSGAQMSGIGHTATTLSVPQYKLGPASLQAGERPNMPATISDMTFVTTRNLPIELALIHDPNKLFIIQVVTRAMEPYYEQGDFLLVEATSSVDEDDIHVVYDLDQKGRFRLIHAESLGPDKTRVHRHIEMERLGLQHPTVMLSADLNVRGRVLRKISEAETAPWVAANGNGNGKVNTSEVAC